MPSPAATSPNFGHLASVDALLAEHGARAERYVFDDPEVALVKLRQFGEVLAQQAAAYAGAYTMPGESQVELLRTLRDARVVDREVADLFHALRKAGNRAVHESIGTRREALHHLRLAWRLGVWFRRAFVQPTWRSNGFVPPPDPSAAEQALQSELAALREALTEAKAHAADLEATSAEMAQLQAETEAEAAAAYEDAATALDLAAETEARIQQLEAEFAERLAAIQAQQAAAAAPDVEALLAQVNEATENLDLDESETRLLVDAQLREAGWEADTVALRYAAGTRPAKGRNVAIAEWPTASGPADYVLFVGLTPVAVVEAKRQRRNVASAIDQAKRYSRDFVDDGVLPAGAPWGPYRIPFAFATNGRPFLRQNLEASGIWFIDTRRATNQRRALEGWYTPAGLKDLLSQDTAAADARLANESSAYLPLRDYQHAAIAAVEQRIADGGQDMLLAMATGTGKTRTALCMMYRLLKAGRFRRILFLVDRTALGEQAHNSFQDVRLENLQPLTDIYDVKGLGDIEPDGDTRLHVATVQGMVKRLMYPNDDARPMPVDAYDCIVVDECHRGYNLDQEMSDTELLYRSEAEYVSRYRRVLDHFDAVRIGLTATPALHTTEIFGAPVFQYSYRQAVIDGHLIDHEPPYRIRTRLTEDGIHWRAGDSVDLFDPRSGEVVTHETPDEIDIAVEGFNTQVVTESFNRVVCEVLAEHIDPSDPAKTMVFCATDAHADLVVRVLKEAFAERYGACDDDAVQKITGAADKPMGRIRRYKNERLPNVAVTVDLLTTGIDVPAVSNLVFLRRVRSRILYEQMLGRATRRCDDIGKESFRIFDAVGLYDALEPYSSMKPVVKRPNLTFVSLVGELLTVTDPGHREAVIDELTAKLQARKRRLEGPALEGFETLAGCDPEATIALLRSGDVDAVVRFFHDHDGLGAYLDGVKLPSRRTVYLSDHDDEVVAVERGYGDGNQRPDDYLAGFKAFIEANRNELAALSVVTQRPRELTRQQLRELKLRLDAAGYSETALRSAWSQVSNQDIAASIIGFIRQQALGSPLVAYEARVDRALATVLASQKWTPQQRKWLDRIGKQLKVETIVDRDALDRGQFRAQGGFARLNKVFDGRLEQVLVDLRDALWSDAS